MFESAELGHKIDKARFRDEEPKLLAALLDAQFDIREDGKLPIVILIIFGTLYMTYHSFLEAAHVLLAVPFALTGGFYLLWLLQYNFSVAVWVGFIALFGAAVQTGIVMVVYLEEAVKRKKEELGQLDRESLLESMQEAGIGRIVNIGADLASTASSIALAEKYPFIYAAAGVHPSDAAQLNEHTFQWLSEQTAHEKVVAVGEIGLDYYWEKDPEVRANQRYWFRRQLNLAREKVLPVSIHSRDAAKDTLEIAKEECLAEIGGVVHCFSYTVEMAREYLNMGMYLGIGGVLTYKNARVLKEVVDYAPMDRIVLETDSPYLTPVPNRGKRNSSLNLPYVVMAIAEIKGITTAEVEDITWENAMKLLIYSPSR